MLLTGAFLDVLETANMDPRNFDFMIP